jgi:hypothetical protein
MDAAMTSPVNASDGPGAVLSRLSASAAGMAAVKILLTDPEALGDDVLKSCLYIAREAEGSLSRRTQRRRRNSLRAPAQVITQRSAVPSAGAVLRRAPHAQLRLCGEVAHPLAGGAP